MGDQPEPLGTARDHRRSTSGVLHITTSTRDLAPRLGNRDAADGALHPITATTIECGTGSHNGTSPRLHDRFVPTAYIRVARTELRHAQRQPESQP